MRIGNIKWVMGAVAAGAALLCGRELPAAEAGGSPLELARQLNQAFIQVADQVSPAVVVITVTHKFDHSRVIDEDNSLFDWLPPQLREQFRDRERKRLRAIPMTSQGSGIVIREDGYILTNSHVVEGASKIKVRFKDGKEYEGVVRGVPDGQSDIAVVKINAARLKEAKLGDSDKTRVGEFAIAIGAPFDLDYSVTFGHVSAKGRSHVIVDPRMDQDFIQTDASINPGNSGGPLININGEVIGINTLIRGLNTGIGFAVPSNLAREVSDQLIRDGKFKRAWLGVEIRALSEDRDYRELLPGLEQGVIVATVRSDGPAAKSELRPTDVITAVDGLPVATAQDLKNQIRSKQIGQPVTLDVFRQGKRLKVKVKTEEWPEETALAEVRRSGKEFADAQSLGLKVEALTTELATRFNLEGKTGVVVSEVIEESLAARQGVKKGDLITEVNQKPVRNPRQFRDALKTADLKKGLVLSLVSDGSATFVILKDSGE